MLANPLKIRTFPTTAACIVILALLASTVPAQDNRPIVPQADERQQVSRGFAKNSTSPDIDINDKRLRISQGTLTATERISVRVTHTELKFIGESSGSGGGKIGGGINTQDFGEAFQEDSDHQLFVYDKEGMEDPFAKLTITRQQSGDLVLKASGYDLFSNLAYTDPVILSQGPSPRVALRWWTGYAPNGGLAIEVDGQIATCLCGLDNRDRMPGLPAYTVGGLFPAGVSIIDIEIAHEDGAACPPPNVQCATLPTPPSQVSMPGGQPGDSTIDHASKSLHPGTSTTARSVDALSTGSDTGLDDEAPWPMLEVLRHLFGDLWDLVRAVGHLVVPERAP